MKAVIIHISLFLFCISEGLYSQELNIAEKTDSVATIQNTIHPIRFAQPSGGMTETSGFFYYRDYPWVAIRLPR
ncbi:MAG: hypothetical protein HZB98_03445 [Bacteroidia bacterium]|nr:hypothetical protein [Bacteroidia bacterium]